MRYLRAIFLAFGVLFILAIGYVFLYTIQDGKSVLGKITTVSKRVVKIYEGGSYDIVFKLEDDNNIYYINRGAENGLNADSLSSCFVGKKLRITKVSFAEKMGGHISKIVYKDSVVYNEFK